MLLVGGMVWTGDMGVHEGGTCTCLVFATLLHDET